MLLHMQRGCPVVLGPRATYFAGQYKAKPELLTSVLVGASTSCLDLLGCRSSRDPTAENMVQSGAHAGLWCSFDFRSSETSVFFDPPEVFRRCSSRSSPHDDTRTHNLPCKHGVH